MRVPVEEIILTPMRSQGPGGQNVNKVSTAIHLRFDVRASSLPEDLKQRILSGRDRRVTADGVVVIKAQRFRTQEANRHDALQRLEELLTRLSVRPKPRKASKPSRAARARRRESKARRSEIKRLRRRADWET